MFKFLFGLLLGIILGIIFSYTPKINQHINPYGDVADISEYIEK